MATLGQILGENKFLKLQPNNKILCDVTGHEMSARADVVQGYISGKSFKKQLEWYKHDYSEFLPYIVEDKRNKKKLYCKLTKEPLNRIPEEVRKHMQGKRFKRLLLEKEAALAAQAAKPAKKVRVEESDDEVSLDPRIVGELLGEGSEDEEEMSAKRAKKGPKRSTEEVDEEDEEEDEDDFADLLGDHSDDGSESSEDDEGAEDFIGSEDGSIDSEEEQTLRKNAVKQASAKKATPVKSVSAKKNAPVAKAAAPKAGKVAKVVKTDKAPAAVKGKSSTKPVASKKK